MSPQIRADSLSNLDPRLRRVLRAAVRTVNTPLAKARLTKELARTPRPIRLEIGGLEPRPGWVVTNVNAVTRLFMDATSAWPLEANSVSYVFADNMIEHIPLDAARSMLAEAYRCMQPGGVIRLVTPDIRGHVEMYLAGASAMQSPSLQQYRNLGVRIEHPVDLIRIPIGLFGHHEGYVYDFETLEAELVRAGFHSVVRCDVGTSTHDALAELDVRGDEGGAQIAVEATR